MTPNCSLGRIHGGAEARAAAEMAAQTFPSFNLDLMYGLPGQTLAEALADVDVALGFNPSHLSCYHLTLEPNTPFGHTPPANLPDEDESFAMQEGIEMRLASAAFEHYETSAFALKGHRCRHNLNYWQFGDYLGIGAGAHCKLSFHDRIVRQMRVKHPRQYMEAVSLASPRCGGENRRGGGTAVRIHDECAAAYRRVRTGLVQRTHRPACNCIAQAAGAGGGARHGDAHAAASGTHAGGAAFSERSAHPVFVKLERIKENCRYRSPPNR